MKTKLLSFASLLAVFNLNAIEIGPTGSGIEFGGFIDMFYQSQDAAGVGNISQDTFDVGQVELNLDFTSGPVSVSVDYDIMSVEGDNHGANLEEAIITYDFGNGLIMTAGKMLSYLGFEAYDPINMYQYSYAYDFKGVYDNNGVYQYGQGSASGQNIYDAYDDGISIDYANDMFSAGLFYSAEEEGGFEYAVAFTGIENLTVKAIMADWDDQYETSTLWASYQFANLLLAFEIAERDNEPVAQPDKEGWLLMGNYGFTDAVALTLRYSEQEEGLDTYEKFTISPSYVFNDNFSGLIEYSKYDENGPTAIDINDLFAVELIYTF
jgi:hypothetical protein